LDEELNCQQDAYSLVLSGQARETPRVVVDVFPFAHELLLAEGRLWELDGLADFVVVAESKYSMRGIPKEKHFSNTLLRQYNYWKDRWQDKLLLVDVDECPEYATAVHKYQNMGDKRPQTIWEVQDSHRACIWKAVEQAKGDQIPDHALIIFSDADEIPGRQAVRHLKHCEIQEKAWPIKMESQSIVVGNFRTLTTDSNVCFGPSSSKKKAPRNTIQFPIYLAEHVRKVGRMDRHGTLKEMYPTGGNPTFLKGGIHITYAGGLPALDYKTMNHAEGGAMLSWIDSSSPDSVCSFTEEDYCRRLQVFQEQPVRAIRTWETHNPTSPLQLLSDDDRARFCGVPWVYIQNRERYKVLWGEEACPTDVTTSS
jgi:hypothetical protein